MVCGFFGVGGFFCVAWFAVVFWVVFLLLFVCFFKLGNQTSLACFANSQVNTQDLEWHKGTGLLVWTWQ